MSTELKSYLIFIPDLRRALKVIRGFCKLLVIRLFYVWKREGNGETLKAMMRQHTGRLTRGIGWSKVGEMRIK